jgi:hypothetical protein
MTDNIMDLDELREKWAEHDRKLETTIRLNRQLLREDLTGRARFALRRLAVLLALGSLGLLGIIVSLGAFIHNNLGMPQFVWPGVFLDVLAIATLGAVNFQIGLAFQIDYNQPVAVIQKRLERLRAARIRYVQGILLTSALAWLPIFVVIMKAVAGVDVYRTFDMNWILWNVIFGLAVIPVGIWLIRKFGNRKFMNELGGYNLKAAADFLGKIEQFESEDPAPRPYGHGSERRAAEPRP